jgi:branched-chain amino acid transport system permease protein
MSSIVAFLLVQDGVTNGAIYALLGLSLVMVYSVTRIIFVPQGELVTYSALTLAELQAGHHPGTIWVTVGGAALVCAIDLCRYFIAPTAALLRSALIYGAIAAGVFCIRFIDLQSLSQWGQIAVTMVIIVPVGCIIYLRAFEPIANASILTLLIVAVAVHFALLGLGVIIFGAEGSRTVPLISMNFSVGSYVILGQAAIVACVAVVLVAIMFVYFECTMQGKALRATAFNRVGARLVGIEPTTAGRLTFLLTGIIATVSGILVSPITTIYYDTGFLIGLKGFLAAIVGGMVSYPLAILGALIIGILETFSSFWASTFKDVIVFALVVPVLLWRNLFARVLEDEDED